MAFVSKDVSPSDTWAGPDSPICAHVELQSRRCLDAYRANPLLIQEHVNIERATAQGGYGRRQIYELVQNGADALIGLVGGKIRVLLTEKALYCANEGNPIDLQGVESILSSHISMKRGNEIGRFGLGFKSVLGITQAPEFYSRSGSFGFSLKSANEKIRALIPSVEQVPVLRIAHPLDPAEAAAGDEILAELMSWATTVVRLPRGQVDTAWLSAEIAGFPAEFLLFSPHLGSLTLIDRVQGTERIVRLEQSGAEVHLFKDDGASAWRVFQTMHAVSEKARKDAGVLADREQVPVIWAVPGGGKPTRGRFWAFFPTEYQTTLSGYLNAPWKTNEDRQNLLRGEFNEELLDAAADLVVRSLPTLAVEDDPGRILDILPARMDETANWADEHLNERIYGLAAQRPSLPDQLGRLVVPSTLRIHPGGVPRQAVDAWAAFRERPDHWCHPSVDTRERRPRAERLLALTGRAPDSLGGWLEALVHTRTPDSSIAAIRVAGLIAEGNGKTLPDLETAAIVLTETGSLVGPGRVFLASDYRAQDPDLALVHAVVAADPGARSALETLGVKPVDAAREFEKLLRSFIGPDEDAKWAALWDLARRVEPKRAAAIVQASNWRRGEIRVRTLSGSFGHLLETLLPGPVVPEDGSRDAPITVDTQFHAQDVDLLTELGAVSAPMRGKGSLEELWFVEYRSGIVAEYLRGLSNLKQRPQEDKLEFDSTTFLGPLEPLLQLSDEGRVRFTEAVLAADPEPIPWTLAHSTRSDYYPSRKFISPVAWLIRREGRLRTTRGVQPVSRCVGRGLNEFAEFLPVCDCSPDTARILGIPNDLAELTRDHWQNGWKEAEGSTNDAMLGRFYSNAAQHIEVPPTSLRCRVGSAHQTIAPEGVTVVTGRHEFDALVSRSIPVLLVPRREDADILVARWGLLPHDRYVRTEVYYVASAPEVALIEAFPILHGVLTEEQQRFQLLRCSVLRLEMLTDKGKTAEDKRFHIERQTVYYQEEVETEELIDQLASELGLTIGAAERAAIIEHRGEQERRAKISAVRSKPTIEGRLLAAVGPQALRRRLSANLIDAVADMHGQVSDELLARIALSVYGVDVLRTFRFELEQNGFQPPVQWNGGRNARIFVRNLGFPREFAGFRRADRDPLWEIDGPPTLPPLHDFQRSIVERTRRLIRREVRPRGLLALPTGAGKTRILVQALIDAFRDGDLRGPILWVAQTDELCEQAVQTWAYVWRGLGPEDRLGISRLWAGNEAEPLEQGTQVVVATIAKMGGIVEDPGYGWLSQATCVVIDEAHGSTEPSYTDVLDWLGLGRGRDRCPLVGLTATPFRGVSEEETLRLVRRYGEYRLDADVFDGDPYLVLQRMGVLARVHHRLLAGTDIDLSEEEFQHLERLHRLPAGVEERLGADRNRNRILMDSIKGLPPDYTVLLFAASVDHAETMAALLTLEGISSAAITAATESGPRRHYVEQFRAGKIRVLTNYGVLSQGFDAPAVKAIYVARPTFSPNLYQQMIGRGLRGPLNGGKPECLIVNIADNVLRYGEQLAFRHFEYLWSAT